jgi:hypothetical protein
MDISRRFEYDEDAILMLRKWMRLTDGPETIVEVGCWRTLKGSLRPISWRPWEAS